jgi:hypothetical protein
VVDHVIERPVRVEVLRPAAPPEPEPPPAPEVVPQVMERAADWARQLRQLRLLLQSEQIPDEDLSILQPAMRRLVDAYNARQGFAR